MSSDLVIRVVFVLLQGCVIEDGVARWDGTERWVQPAYVQGFSTITRKSTGLKCSAVILDSRRHFVVGSPREIKDRLENAGR